jgi:hypothetical protein
VSRALPFAAGNSPRRPATKTGDRGLAGFSLQFFPFRRTLAATKNPIPGATSMNPDPQQMHGIIAAVIGVYLVFLVVIMAVIIVPFWFICKKAGFTPWLSLLNLVPLGTLILLYVLAFAEWKVIPAAQMAWQPPYPPQPPFPPQA